ncbi:phosphate ABC transporter substrate-binding protein [Photobacterium jeanii]|uniref:Phosphate-binding protein n=2 Tax=Vibrionaceae TaxID=641 RepID=A0A178K8X7_9GAMM|nr:phosphate ABC transporter substrate-binding protein [Photobacterium jeanii]OAN13781.1 phosphate ABC transporter substrate-binding protein [Photobacterium jeanii]PST92759.1 phosphate ABC transporter substrate-binding protein [Photobacterium jeanii]
MKTKVIGALALAGSMAFNVAAVANETISVVGSSSVTPLMEVFGETYSKANPSVFVEVQGPGSSAGIRAAKDGSADLGMSSRNLKDSEKSADLKEVVVARDGIAVVVHNSNPVKDLAKADITKIYKGEITNWKQVGGEDKPIVVVTRDTASGTRGAFEDIMGLKKKINDIKVSAISQRAQVASGNGQLKTTVANNPFAIGYISLGTVDNSLKAVSVDGHAPSVDTIKSGEYKVQRPFLVLYQATKIKSASKTFLDWTQTDEAQQLVTGKGYIAVN